MFENLVFFYIMRESDFLEIFRIRGRFIIEYVRFLFVGSWRNI